MAQKDDQGEATRPMMYSKEIVMQGLLEDGRTNY